MANSNVGGAWLLPDRDLTFKLTQEGSAVRGEFGNKVLTYGVAGTVEGRKLSLSWKLVFGWSDRPDSGSGVLTLSPDGAILSGSFPLVGQNGNWTLTRPPAVPTPAPPPAAHPGLPFPLPPQRQSFGDAGGSRSGVQAISGPGGGFGPRCRLQISSAESRCGRTSRSDRADAHSTRAQPCGMSRSCGRKRAL